MDGSSLSNSRDSPVLQRGRSSIGGFVLAKWAISDDEIIAFLNNGVSSLFIASQDAKTADHLVEQLNVPKERVVVEENGVFSNQFMVKQKFSQDKIVSIKKLRKGR